MKVLVVGGGIAGLAIAWRLSRLGVATEVIERGICGRGASWAAAGMLAPGGELNGHDSAVVTFAHHAHEMWPSFAAELEQASGMSLSYARSGSLMIADSEESATRLRQMAGVSARWLSGEELLAREPLLSPSLPGGLEIANDAQVDNRAVCDALCAALRAKGALIHENCEATSLLIERGSARAAITSFGTMETDVIVLATGAWMQLIAVAGIELPPIRPVKGQMLALAPPAGVALPKSLIWSDDVYLVAQRHRLLIGATVEDAGFDSSVDRNCAGGLLQSASRLIPSLTQWHLAEIWAGLRPRTPDDAPVLGATAISNLYVAGGQFRNGILFAPAVAEYIAKTIQGEKPGALSAAFDPQRFAQSS